MSSTIKTAIVLAGGLGTRLQQVVSDVPKCLAPIAGKPFLHYLLLGLQRQGIEHVIFSLGHKHELVIDFLNASQICKSWSAVVESEPLGTGGAIRLAAASCFDSTALVVNGDTWFDVDLEAFAKAHAVHQSKFSLALKPMVAFDRYGTVEIDAAGWITAFREKSHCAEGLISGGVYAIEVAAFLQETAEGKFSVEQDFFQPRAGTQYLLGVPQPGYFIDIGIPTDYDRANQELPNLFA